MPGTIMNRTDERFWFLHQREGLENKLFIGERAGTTNIINFSRRPFGYQKHQRAYMIRDINPVTNVAPVTIERKLFILKRVGNQQRDRLFRKLVGAEIF